jgi:hypothetical protein
VASQGATVEEATSNLREAIELFLECADAEEIKRRRRTEVCRIPSAARVRRGAPARKSYRHAASHHRRR